MNKLAFIGGTGVYNPEILTDLHSETIETPYGTAKYELGYFKDKPIVFMARHGVNHTIPPQGQHLCFKGAGGIFHRIDNSSWISESRLQARRTGTG